MLIFYLSLLHWMSITSVCTHPSYWKLDSAAAQPLLLPLPKLAALLLPSDALLANDEAAAPLASLSSDAPLYIVSGVRVIRITAGGSDVDVDVAAAASSASVKMCAASALTITGLLRISSAMPLCAQRRRSVDVDVGAAVAVEVSSGSNNSSNGNQRPLAAAMVSALTDWWMLIYSCPALARALRMAQVSLLVSPSRFSLIASANLQLRLRFSLRTVPPKVTFRFWFLSCDERVQVHFRANNETEIEGENK